MPTATATPSPTANLEQLEHAARVAAVRVAESRRALGEATTRLVQLFDSRARALGDIDAAREVADEIGGAERLAAEALENRIAARIGLDPYASQRADHMATEAARLLAMRPAAEGVCQRLRGRLAGLESEIQKLAAEFGLDAAEIARGLRDTLDRRGQAVRGHFDWPARSE